VFEVVAKLGDERLVVHRIVERVGEFCERRFERFWNVSAAVRAELTGVCHGTSFGSTGRKSYRAFAPPSRRPTVSSPLSDTDLLLAAAAAVVVEAAVRVAAGPVAAVVVPPVAAVSLLGRHVAAEDASGPLLARLAGVALGGHAVALTLGAAAFLLLDTPVRAALYLLGRGDLLSVEVHLLAPLPTVAAGAVVGWTVPAVAVARVATGDGLRSAGSRALAAALARPRSLSRLAGVHAALAGWLAASAGLVVVFATARAPTVGLAAGAALAACGAVVALAAGADAAREVPVVSRDRAAGSRSLARPALVAVLVAGLVVGAAGVRAADLRPLDRSAAPLPDDPDAAYATAFANTEAASHEYRVAVGDDEGEPFVVTRRIDRADRRYRSWSGGEAIGPDIYASAGTGSPPRRTADRFTLGTRTVGPDDRPVRAAPDYLLWTETYDWEGGLTPPDPVDGWATVERTDDRVVLALTDPAAVFAALNGREPAGLANVTAARVRAVVDRESGTLVRVETRVDLTVVEGEERYDVAGRSTHEFAVGVDVERPAELGAPSLGERLWSVAVY
jgi:hypothetical protein